MEITKVTNNRIYISEDKFYRVNADIIYEFSLKKGMILNEQLKKELFVQLILFRSYGFLARKDYTEKELRMKLSEEFPKDSPFEDVFEKLREKTYLDDYSYAKNYINSKKSGKKKVYYELIMKGVKKEYLDEIYLELIIDEKDLIRQNLKKIENKEERKQVEYLIRKGYNIKDILEVIKENKMNNE